MPSETFRCVGCNKELEMQHMRVSIWSRDLSNESDESSQLVLNQKIDCKRILKDEIHWLKTDKPDEGWFSSALDNWDMDLDTPKNPLPWNREKILMLLRNAYRILGKIPLGHQVFLDPYTTRTLCGALESHQYNGEGQEDDDVIQILEILYHSMTQMEKPLCWSCAGEGICIVCKDEPKEDV